MLVIWSNRNLFCSDKFSLSILSIFEITQNYNVILFKVIRRKKLVKSVSFLPASIKSLNPIQKYPHITELFACTRKMLTIMFLFPTNSLISSGTCSTPKLSK